jgi:PHD-like zinc-binding domain
MVLLRLRVLPPRGAEAAGPPPRERTARGRVDRKLLARESRRFAAARMRLLSHAALERAPASLARLPPPPEPVAVLEALGRGMGPVRAWLVLARAPVAGSAPSLASGPLWDRARAAGYDTRALSDREVLKSVVVSPLDISYASEDLVASLMAAVRARSCVGLVDDPAPTGNVTLQTPSPESSAVAMKSASSAPTPRHIGRRKRGISTCCFCPDPALFGGIELSEELLGPFVNARGRASLRLHFTCACWAPQVYSDAGTGRLHGVYDEYVRGRQLRCFGCGTKGATVGCYIEKCKKTFHFRCLEAAGARKVEKYFATFCALHAHLAELESYQLMLEAATIADVTSRVPRRDTTHGLDTPHSKYTCLRRGETELIFSARAGICSHVGVFDVAKVLFSGRRRVVLVPSHRLVVGDRPRRIRVSALGAATGRLAQLRCPLKRRVRSSTDSSGAAGSGVVGGIIWSPIFLLRNLERAPDFTADEVSIRKLSASSFRRCHGTDLGSDAARRKRPYQSNGSLNAGYMFVEEGSAHVVREDDTRALQGEDSYDRDIRMRNQKEVVDLSADDNDTAVSRPRLALRIAVREEGILALREKREHEELRRRNKVQDGIRRKEERKERLRKRMLKEELMREQASKLAGTTSGPSQAADARPKIRSAWETFLDEQLPSERMVRPEDDVQCAMRNIARLWGLLTPIERAAYEDRSKQGV